MAKDLINKIFENETDIAGVAGSYAQNRQRKYQESNIKDWNTMYLLLVLKYFNVYLVKSIAGRADYKIILLLSILFDI